MAIVEDGARSDEEDTEIEVYVEEDDQDQDSDDSDDYEDDDEEKKFNELKVQALKVEVLVDPYNYDTHIDLIKALWNLSQLDEWRAAYSHLQELMVIRPEHWLQRLQTEETLAHSAQSHKFMADLFQQAALDCYSIPILSKWCSWAMSTGIPELTRAQLDEVLKRGGSDPFSGKLFWDTRLEFEKMQLIALSKDHADYKKQNERVLWCLEEVVSRPLLNGELAWKQFEDLALLLYDQKYVDKIKERHEAALDYLKKITPFEDDLLTSETPEEKYKIFEKYLVAVQDLSKNEIYSECDSIGVLKVLYERLSTDCMSCKETHNLLKGYVKLVQEHSSRATVSRVLDTCTRRFPKKDTFWMLKMEQAEHEEKEFDEVKSILEMALSKGMETYKQAEFLWMSYLVYCRRQTNFDNEANVERLRRTFRLAWDSLDEMWGPQANDCEVPLFWAQLEYKCMNDPKQGKEIFEEMFKYGENKTMSKYWEMLLILEEGRGCSENKLREMHRRALQNIQDYPPAVVRMWRDFELLRGSLKTAQQCFSLCETKLKEWRENYEAMKDKMGAGSKHKGKQNKKNQTNKGKSSDNKEVKRKRKSDEDGKAEESGVKRKKDVDEEVIVNESDSGGGVKRPHNQEDDAVESKRHRRDSSPSSSQPAGREACTLFVSNLDFKVNEQNLRDKLSNYGEIVSMRVKAGVKAFGGSICYCQYKSPESVEEAIKHDRTPLDGRPMFLSKYSARKSKPNFKYATTAERNKLFVKNLPYDHCTKEALTETFDKYGTLKDVRIVTFKDGKPKGLAYIEYEDEDDAAKALKETDGMQLGDRKLQVAISEPPPKASPTPTPTLGQSKRDVGGGMRRTQLSSFIPSVLQKPSTSKSVSNGGQSNGDEKRSLSNTDFRNMLLNK